MLASGQRIAQHASRASSSSFASTVAGADASAISATSIPECIQANLATIRASLQTGTYADLGMCNTIESLLSESSRSSSVQFFEVLNDPAISICLIAFPPGSSIPLHDHPGMHVFTKVISGELRITMLDIEQPMPHADIASATSTASPAWATDPL
jgi:hypothetical protein